MTVCFSLTAAIRASQPEISCSSILFLHLFFYPYSSPGFYGTVLSPLTDILLLVSSTSSFLQLQSCLPSLEWKLRKFRQRDPKHRSRENKLSRRMQYLGGCKYISMVKYKQYLEGKHLFQIRTMRTKSIYRLKTTVASSQATLSTVVMKLKQL